MNNNELISSFKSVYGESEELIHLYFGPGRVNLIGEHTDYNGGYVFPCALSFGTYLAIRKTSDPFLEFHSEGFEYSAKIPLRSQYDRSGKEWVNYPLGIIETFLTSRESFNKPNICLVGNSPTTEAVGSIM